MSDQNNSKSVLRNPHSDEDRSNLIQLYGKKRIDIQHDFYKKREQEYSVNMGCTFFVSIVAISMTTVVAGINTQNPNVTFALIAALLPSISALSMAFQRIYDWEREISLYVDAQSALTQLQIELPEADEKPILGFEQTLPQIVTNTERILNSEVNQWGQAILEEEQTAASSSDLFNEFVKREKLSTEQVETMRNIWLGTGAS